MSDQSIHQDCQATGSSTAVYTCHRRDPRRGDDTHTVPENTTTTQTVCANAAGSESCGREWNGRTHQWRLHRVLHGAGRMAGSSCHNNNNRELRALLTQTTLHTISHQRTNKNSKGPFLKAGFPTKTQVYLSLDFQSLAKSEFSVSEKVRQLA